MSVVLRVIASAWLMVFGFVAVLLAFGFGYQWLGPWGLLLGVAALATYAGLLSWWAVDR